MDRSSKYLLTPLVLALFLFTSIDSFARDNNARVRAVHASPDAPVVDILVNDNPAFTEVAFGDISPYASVPANVYNVKVVPTGAGPGSAVIDADVNLFFNTDYTVVAVNTLANIEPLVLEDDNGWVWGRKARVRFVHASPDAPAVDIRAVDGPFLFQDIEFKGVGDYVTVPAGTYDLEVQIAGTGDTVLSVPGVTLKRGTTYTAFAVGLAGGTPALSVLLSVDSSNRSRFSDYK